MSSQPDAGYLARCLAWAQEGGKIFQTGQFAARLNGRQIEDELADLFRSVPSHARDLVSRLSGFLDPVSTGPLHLIDAGGEATVFFEAANQSVVKYFAPPNEGAFGWVISGDEGGKFRIRGGSLFEALWRFAWFEANFASGLDLDGFGAEGSFLTLSQPFFVGRRPCEDELTAWMRDCGWETWHPPTDQGTLAQHSWRRGNFVATDVLPRNAIVAEADGQIRAIDFIVRQI